MVAAVRTLERRGVVRTVDKLLLSLSEGLGEVVSGVLGLC